jgi:hypothetical protein
MNGGPEVVPVREALSAPHGPPLAPPGAAFAPPGAGPLDEPPPIGVRAPAPAARLTAGFWPVPCLLVADDGGGRLRIAVAGGTTVHAVVGATVRSSREPVVEIETLDGRRFRYAPVTDVRVAPGDVLKSGAVLGRVAGEHAAQLELAVRDPDGRWVDPYPLLVGLADPNELGVDPRTGDGVDPDFLGLRAPVPTPVSAVEDAPPPEPPPSPASIEPAEPAEAPSPPPPPPPPPPQRVADDILAAMVAPSPPPRDEPVEE